MADKKSSEYIVSPGEPVGVIAAESLGEPSTQMVLRTFHSAGIASNIVVSGLPRVEELIDAKKKPKAPIMMVMLTGKAEKNYEVARDIRHKIEGVRIRDLMAGFTEDFKNNVMHLELDKEKLSTHEMTSRNVISRLSKFEGVDVSSEGDNTVKIKVKADKTARSMRTSRTIFVNVRNATVVGISGIKKAVVQEDDEKRFYIMTTGSNIEEVIKIEGVDKERVYSNDIFETMRVYGVEAARNVISHELHNTIQEEGISVSFKHISLVADAMTFSGSIRGVGRHGLAGAKESVFARAAFEETVKHFINAGVFGEKDPLKGVAENIMVGKQVSVGTGIVKLVMKKEDLKKIKPSK
jgi:DNA-directed RNA polymerase subunit A"